MGNTNRVGITSIKHIPLRTCIACRQTRAKRELVRIVRTAEGEIRIDGTGKQVGRGAYLCRAPECWQAGLNSKKLEQALKGSVSGIDRGRLLGEAQEFFGGTQD